MDGGGIDGIRGVNMVQTDAMYQVRNADFLSQTDQMMSQTVQIMSQIV